MRRRKTWDSATVTWFVERPVCAIFGEEEVEEITVYLECSYKPATPDTYDKSRGGPGGWDPGNPPEAEIYNATDEDGSVILLTEEEEQQALNYIYENPPDLEMCDDY